MVWDVNAYTGLTRTLQPADRGPSSEAQLLNGDPAKRLEKPPIRMNSVQ